ncbi:MAG: phage tail sheath subtilisin-like domain-containing protein [Ktedonobacteraceae bacterium]
MPVQPTYPGVYIEEIPSGVHTITGVATSITAFIGRTPLGPVSEPTTITSFGDFERLFGGLDYATPLTYAVRDFFNNGGSQAIIVRLFHAAAGSTATMTHGTLQLEAASSGSWGKDLAVYVTNDNITSDVAARYNLATTDLFNLVVRRGTKKNAPILERIPNVTYKDGERNIANVLKDSSQYLRVPEGTTLSGDAPAVMSLTGDPIPVNGGADSATLVLDDYLGGQQGEANKIGIYALNKADLFNLLVIAPDVRGGNTSIDVYSAALELCVRRRAFLIVDSPHEWSDNKETAANTVFTAITNPQTGDPKDISPLSGEFARNAAIYFPRVIEADALRGGQLDTFTPSGIVAGIMARTDSERGVWKAPAGLDASLSGIRGLNVKLNDAENGMLNPLGINCIRSFPVNGTVVWGARTLRGADQLGDDYKYVPVRRLALFIEESLYRGTQWVVFEPNDEPLWAQIRLNIGAFMHNLFRQGAFQGQTPRDAYLVKCDKETTTQNDINLGIVNILVAFAPLKPAEFVIIQIQQLAGQIEV